ncbi:MAG: carboxylating nicotinate-nucleotide diphosphorylase [Streptomycetales bacterium]
MTIGSTTAKELEAGGLDPAGVERLVRTALTEDLADGVDVTSVATIPGEATGAGDVVARADGVVAGLPVAAAVFEIAGAEPATTAAATTAATRTVAEGSRVRRGDVLLAVQGPASALLTAERTALNFLCHLSGVATQVRCWADALEGSGAVVLDTRKTTPGLRALEKYAVRQGGGANKRMGLYDVAMIKDNHVLAAGGIAEAFDAVRRNFPGVEIQVECDTIGQAREAVLAGATFLLCDNMDPEALREVVTEVRRASSAVQIEATGGLTLDRAGEYALTGVDFLSVGAITHSAPILDIAFDLRPGKST